MSNKRGITFAVLLAYLLGFILGCLGLSILSAGSPAAAVASLTGQFASPASRPRSAGVSIPNKAPKALQSAARAPLELTALTFEVNRGQQAAIRVHTQSGAACTIRYITPTGVDFRPPELQYQTAGQDGYCTWVWSLPANSPTGVGAVVTAAGGSTETFFFTIK